MNRFFNILWSNKKPNKKPNEAPIVAPIVAPIAEPIVAPIAEPREELITQSNVNDNIDTNLNNFFSTEYSKTEKKSYKQEQEHKYSIRAHGAIFYEVTYSRKKYYTFDIPKNVELYTYVNIDNIYACPIKTTWKFQCNLYEKLVKPRKAYLYKKKFPNVLLVNHSLDSKMETAETAETDGNNGNRRFLLERITTDRNGEERICSAAATTILAEPCD
jgi:hypothetical protein